MPADKILIVDDEPSILSQLKWGLSDDYHVLTALDADEARRLLRDERPNVVTLDVALGTRDADREAGLGLLEEIVDHYPHVKVIMVTGNDSRENALAAIRRGAVDWYSKPIQLEELKTILARAFHIQRLETEQAAGAPSGRRRYHRLVGESEALRRVFGLIQRVAPTDATVLVLGENGTGKELVAHAVHQASHRPAGPLIPRHCRAVPHTLLE